MSDVLNEYVKAKGDMNLVMESVPLCKEEDIPRFVTIISDAISNGTAKKFTKFAKTKNCVTIFKNDASEAAEAEELAHKLGISFSGDDSLQTMIQVALPMFSMFVNFRNAFLPERMRSILYWQNIRNQTRRLRNKKILVITIWMMPNLRESRVKCLQRKINASKFNYVIINTV